MIQEQKAIHLQQSVHAVFHGSRRPSLKICWRLPVSLLWLIFSGDSNCCSWRSFMWWMLLYNFFRPMDAVSMVLLSLRHANEIQLTTSVANACRWLCNFNYYVARQVFQKLRKYATVGLGGGGGRGRSFVCFSHLCYCGIDTYVSTISHVPKAW